MWNVVSPTVPTGSVDGGPQGSAHGRVGMGCRRKRRPIGNGSDRGSSFALPRKGADFRRVLDHEKGAERLNHRGYFRRCVPSGTIEGPVGVWRQLSTTPDREGDPLSGRRVLCGALSRLEPGAGKLARRVLRGGVSREARPLPDYPPRASHFPGGQRRRTTAGGARRVLVQGTTA